MSATHWSSGLAVNSCAKPRSPISLDLIMQDREAQNPDTLLSMDHVPLIISIVISINRYHKTRNHMITHRRYIFAPGKLPRFLQTEHTNGNALYITSFCALLNTEYIASHSCELAQLIQSTRVLVPHESLSTQELRTIGIQIFGVEMPGI